MRRASSVGMIFDATRRGAHSIEFPGASLNLSNLHRPLFDSLLRPASLAAAMRTVPPGRPKALAPHWGERRAATLGGDLQATVLDALPRLRPHLRALRRPHARAHVRRMRRRTSAHRRALSGLRSAGAFGATLPRLSRAAAAVLRHRAAWIYAFPVDRLVHAFKYGGRLALALPLATALVAAVRDARPLPDAVVALPLARFGSASGASTRRRDRAARRGRDRPTAGGGTRPRARFAAASGAGLAGAGAQRSRRVRGAAMHRGRTRCDRRRRHDHRCDARRRRPRGTARRGARRRGVGGRADAAA